MELVEKYFVYFVAIQLLHSIEEIYFHFEKVWPLWKMSRKSFIVMELMLLIFLISNIFVKYPYRNYFMALFNLVMFANGLWHLTGAAIAKKYVPGLITASFAIIVFLVYYLQILAK